MLNGGVISDYLLRDRQGNAIAYQTVRSAFARARDKADVESFTLHDLKAAGSSDHQYQAGWHRSARMRDVDARMASKVIATSKLIFWCNAIFVSEYYR